MNNNKKIAKSVVLGYFAIAAQILYSFGSIPLALHYLPKAQFGMFGLISMITGYLMLAEMGITNSVMRHLMECKEGKDTNKYGRIFVGSALIMGLIAIVILILGIITSQYANYFFEIPNDLSKSFRQIIILQSTLLAVNMATQILGVPLYVHHRQDISQIMQTVLFLIYYVALNLAFRSGLGIYSLLINQAIGIFWIMFFSHFNCRRLGFYPKKGTRKLPNRDEWKSIWSYSRDVFTIQASGLVLSTIPQLMIARLMGLEANANWTIATRPFAILRQIVGRPFDVTLPIIYDSYIEGNMKNVTSQWLQITQVVLAIAGSAFAVAAANNAVFLDLWTHGKMHWDPLNHWMLAFYFYVTTAAGLASCSVSIDKSIGRSRFVGIVQSIITLIFIIPMTKWLGFTGLILVVTLPFIPGMTYIGLRYLGKITNQPYLQLSWQGIIRPTIMTPLAGLAAWLCSMMTPLLPGYAGLILSATTGTLFATSIMFYFGLSAATRDRNIAPYVRSFLKHLGVGKSDLHMS
jgi:O-antigen/teichoic acid export membrane protein